MANHSLLANALVMQRSTPDHTVGEARCAESFSLRNQYTMIPWLDGRQVDRVGSIPTSHRPPTTPDH